MNAKQTFASTVHSLYVNRVNLQIEFTYRIQCIPIRNVSLMCSATGVHRNVAHITHFWHVCDNEDNILIVLPNYCAFITFAQRSAIYAFLWDCEGYVSILCLDALMESILMFVTLCCGLKCLSIEGYVANKWSAVRNIFITIWYVHYSIVSTVSARICITYMRGREI